MGALPRSGVFALSGVLVRSGVLALFGVLERVDGRAPPGDWPRLDLVDRSVFFLRT
jgi:hypothetical protein